jgi:uridylate kinase
MKFQRILLKLSGETLSGSEKNGITDPGLKYVVSEIAGIHSKNIQLALVIGAGNIWRGAGKSISRVTADYMGMLATVINSLALGDVLNKAEIKCKIMSAFGISGIVERYSAEEALKCLDKGRVVILAGGTGNPFFTTDTTAALRASEIKADVLLKATQVDGVYDDDPKKNNKAKRFSALTYEEAINKKLRVMDTSSFSLCMENNLPIIVFDFYKKGNLKQVLEGKNIGTLISNKQGMGR